MAPLAAIATKEMVNAAFETTLAQGIAFERRLFHGLFGTEDQKEGMAAFVDKAKPSGDLEGTLNNGTRSHSSGLGNMGGGMAANLAKAGHDVTRLRSFRSRARQGRSRMAAALAESAAEAVRRCRGGRDHAPRRQACPRGL